MGSQNYKETRDVRDLGRCEHTVLRDGQPQFCDRPVVDPVDRVCDRPGDHVEEEFDDPATLRWHLTAVHGLAEEERQDMSDPECQEFHEDAHDFDCDDRCVAHAPDCDGYCDHERHVNKCWTSTVYCSPEGGAR